MRLALLRGGVLFGVLVTALTETLGFFHLLEPWVVRTVWALILAAVISRGILKSRSLTLPTCVPADAVSLVGIAGGLTMLLLVACTAVLSAPNTYDVLAYHMPRVVYWAQAHSVAFFPTQYVHQNLMPPLGEYILLHVYLISGGDHLINLVQTAALLGTAAGVSLTARELGAGPSGQVVAALCAVTVPVTVLEASGAKNDVVLAFWLVAAVYFAVRYTRTRDRVDLTAAGLALGLATLTKGTALILGTPVLAAAFAPLYRSKKVFQILAVIPVCVLFLNAPFYTRYFHDTGGHFASFGLNNDRLGLAPILSNALRNGATELGSTNGAWDRGVYRLVNAVHRTLGIALNDPATTYWGCSFSVPQHSTHEAVASNLAHTFLLLGIFLPLSFFVYRKRRRRWMLLYGGIAGAFLLFCATFKYQPYHPRLLLPLYALGSVLIGLVAESLLPRWGRALTVLLLLWVARPYVFENYLRPLTGSFSVFRTSRDDSYLSELRVLQIVPQYKEAVRLVRESGCGRVGIDYAASAIEYPLQALLRETDSGVQFFHTAVEKAAVCAVVCLDCADNPEKQERYASFRRVALPPLIVFQTGL